MANVSKLIFGAAIAAVTIASPALSMLPKAGRQFLFIT